MTNLFFEKIQISELSGATEGNRSEKPAQQQNMARLVVIFVASILLLLTVGAVLFKDGGANSQGFQNDNPSSQAHVKAAPLDLLP